MRQRQPSSLFYLLALLLCLGGWVAGFAIAAGDWSQLDDAKVSAIDQTKAGNGVLSSKPGRIAIFTDTVQPKRQVTCRAVAGGTAYEAKPAKIELEVTSGGVDWHLLAVTAQVANPRASHIVCTPRDRMVDKAAYGVAPAPDFHRANIGNGVGSVATLAAVILSLWTYLRRRRFAKGTQ